jgi:hypothetical protein
MPGHILLHNLKFKIRFPKVDSSQLASWNPDLDDLLAISLPFLSRATEVKLGFDAIRGFEGAEEPF